MEREGSGSCSRPPALPRLRVWGGRAWGVGWTPAAALGWLIRKKVSSGGEQASAPPQLGSVVGLRLISDPFRFSSFDENSSVFSVLRKALSKLRARQVPAPLRGGSPQRQPAHPRTPEGRPGGPRFRLSEASSALSSGGPPTGCHLGPRPIGRGLRPVLWAHAQLAPPTATNRLGPRPSGGARAGAGACVSVHERACPRRFCRFCSRALCRCPRYRRCRRRHFSPGSPRRCLAEGRRPAAHEHRAAEPRSRRAGGRAGARTGELTAGPVGLPSGRGGRRGEGAAVCAGRLGAGDLRGLRGSRGEGSSGCAGPRDGGRCAAAGNGGDPPSGPGRGVGGGGALWRPGGGGGGGGGGRRRAGGRCCWERPLRRSNPLAGGKVRLPLGSGPTPASVRLALQGAAGGPPHAGGAAPGGLGLLGASRC